MAIHKLKIAPEYFQPVMTGEKTFEIRKNDRGYQVDDILLLNEFANETYTGKEVAVQVTYMTSFNQQPGYIVLATQFVPKSFIEYLSLTDKEKDVFKEVISHLHLYGYSNRDAANTCWDIIRTLLEHDELSNTDQQWYMEYWNED